MQQAMVFDGECVGVSNALRQSVFAESPKGYFMMHIAKIVSCASADVVVDF